MKVGHPPGILFIRADLCGQPLEVASLRGIAELKKHYELHRLNSAASSRVFKFSADLAGTEETVYFKEYLDRSLWDAIKHIVRPSRAVRAFRASRMLERRGFQIPEILLLGERRTTVLTKRSFVVMAEVANATAVGRLLRTESVDLSAKALRTRRDMLRAFGLTVGRMHSAGIVHGDLRLGNVLARDDNGWWEFFFLDNERTRRWPWLPPHLRLKNLVQVNMITHGVTTADRFRFFRAYLSVCPRLLPAWKQWARRVRARTEQRQAAYRGRGRTIKA